MKWFLIRVGRVHGTSTSCATFVCDGHGEVGGDANICATPDAYDALHPDEETKANMARFRTCASNCLDSPAVHACMSISEMHLGKLRHEVLAPDDESNFGRRESVEKIFAPRCSIVFGSVNQTVGKSYHPGHNAEKFGPM